MVIYRTSNPVWGREGVPRWVRFPCASANLQNISFSQCLTRGFLSISCPSFQGEEILVPRSV